MDDISDSSRTSDKKDETEQDIDVTDMRSVLYAAFGKKLESHKWMILVDIIDATKLKYESVIADMKKTDFIPVMPPSSSTVYRHGEVTLALECLEQWQLCFGKAEWQVKAETIVDHRHHTVTVEDPSASSKSLLIAVNVLCRSKGKPLEELNPSRLSIGFPLEESTQVSISLKHEHFQQDVSNQI